MANDKRNVNGNLKVTNVEGLEKILTEIESLQNEITKYESAPEDKYIREAEYVFNKVSKLFGIGFFSNKDSSKTNYINPAIVENKKRPIQFTTFDDLISFIKPTVDYYHEMLKSEKELQEKQESVKKSKIKLNAYNYYYNLREVERFVGQSANNLESISVRSNPEIENLLNAIVKIYEEKIKGEYAKEQQNEYYSDLSDYNSVKYVVGDCISNNFNRLDGAISFLRVKSRNGSISGYQASSLVDKLEQERHCIYCNVLLDSFKNYPHLQNLIKNVFGNEQKMYTNVFLREIRKLLSSNNAKILTEDPKKLNEELKKNEKELSLAQQNLITIPDKERSVYVQVDEIMKEAIQQREAKLQSAQKLSEMKARKKNLVNYLKQNDNEILLIIINKYSKQINELEQRIDLLASDRNLNKKTIVNGYKNDKGYSIKGYISELTSIYLSIIEEFMKYKKIVSFNLYANGDTVRTKADIDNYSSMLDRIYEEFKNSLETVKSNQGSSLGLLDRADILAKTPDFAMKNLKIFSKGKIQYRNLRIQRHEIIFDGLMANFQEFYQRLSSPLEDPNKQTQSMYSYLYSINPQLNLLDAKDTFSRMFNDAFLLQDEKEEEQCESGKKKKKEYYYEKNLFCIFDVSFYICL